MYHWGNLKIDISTGTLIEIQNSELLLRLLRIGYLSSKLIISWSSPWSLNLRCVCVCVSVCVHVWVNACIIVCMHYCLQSWPYNDLILQLLNTFQWDRSMHVQGWQFEFVQCYSMHPSIEYHYSTWRWRTWATHSLVLLLVILRPPSTGNFPRFPWLCYNFAETEHTGLRQGAYFRDSTGYCEVNWTRGHFRQVQRLCPYLTSILIFWW
jgi:hypothetical protein